MGKIENAIFDFSEVLKLDPDHVNAAYAKAACLNKLGEFGKAIEGYRRALDMDVGGEGRKRKGSGKGGLIAG